MKATLPTKTKYSMQLNTKGPSINDVSPKGEGGTKNAQKGDVY